MHRFKVGLFALVSVATAFCAHYRFGFHQRERVAFTNVWIFSGAITDRVPSRRQQFFEFV
jgi:hypothetical protein